MADENGNGGGAATTGENEIGGDVNVNVLKLARKQIEAKSKQDGIKIERARIAGIRDVFALHIDRGPDYTDLMNECIDRGVNVDKAKDYLLELLGDMNPEPLAADYVQREVLTRFGMLHATWAPTSIPTSSMSATGPTG